MANVNGTASNAHDGAVPHSKSNPHFRLADRPIYEIGRLLRELPPDYFAYGERPADQHLIAIAAGNHARNAGDVVLNGLQALGAVMSVAAMNEGMSNQMNNFVALGQLIQHLTVELEFLREIEFIGDTAEKTLGEGNVRKGASVADAHLRSFLESVTGDLSPVKNEKPGCDQ